MKVTSTKTHIQAERTARITEDRPRVALPYSVRPTQIEIDSVAIQYTVKDGAWVIESSFNIVVSGWAVKKDGTPSKNYHSRTGPSQEGAWPWLNTIIRLLRPVGDANCATLNDWKVIDE